MNLIADSYDTCGILYCRYFLICKMLMSENFIRNYSRNVI
ncbi:hypothetical protein BACPEC_02988 [[Bacteroides] pectinophilus ATCC 43243]|uniref:Uncharacterized protein n=1 Tax=[Bacteroides] pectinophilus ATCC 43243 TaxID=483218 RepID=B7AW88_9FIRM|nr:hypothetical protein BACPEC_02988 [[Bacteroides] pectinophilus ATCC 43243]